MLFNKFKDLKSYIMKNISVLFTLFSVMWREGGEGPPPRPEVTYITTFAPHRTDAQIAASNAANQARKDKLIAEQAERDEQVKGIYRTLGRMSGMDVDKIEREGAAEQAAEQQAERERYAAMRDPAPRATE